MPDGPLKSRIQFDSKLSPENWLYSFSLNQKSKYAVPNIDNTVLKYILKEPNKYLKNIRYFFRKKLEMAIKKVEEELDEDSSDSIDHSIAQTEAKKRKVCVNGHMNENVRGNRIKCKTCKSMLKDVLVSSTTNAIEDTLEVETLKCKSKSILHHPIDNVILENKPEVKSMG